jgi:hypothetical protein
MKDVDTVELLKKMFPGEIILDGDVLGASQVQVLNDEIARLRALLIANDIDPDATDEPDAE